MSNQSYFNPQKINHCHFTNGEIIAKAWIQCCDIFLTEGVVSLTHSAQGFSFDS